MSAPSPARRQRPPLNAAMLDELALRYVGRFATSRAKLTSYLGRKVRERGWGGEGQPDFDALADKFCRLGYVDDAAYAMAKSQSLVSRGYGRRRVDQKLRADGIGDDDGLAARELADTQAIDAALRFAKRRRIGPFATGPADPRATEKAVAAMVRAGHSFGLARKIASFARQRDPDLDQLRDLLAEE